MTTATRSAPSTATSPNGSPHNYRKAGGSLELLYIDNATRAGAASDNPTDRVLPTPHLT